MAGDGGRYADAVPPPHGAGCGPGKLGGGDAHARGRRVHHGKLPLDGERFDPPAAIERTHDPIARTKVARRAGNAAGHIQERPLACGLERPLHVRLLF